MAAAPALEAATIWAFKHVIDDALVPATLDPLPGLAVVILGLALAAAAVSYLDDVLAGWIGGRFLLDLRTDVYRHVMGLSPERLDRGRAGDLVARLTGDVAEIEQFVLSGPSGAVADLARVAVFGTALVLLDWRLALATAAVLPVFAFLAQRFSVRIKEVSRERRRRSGSLSALTEEGVANTALVQAHGREEDEVRRFHEEGRGILRAQLAGTRLRAVYAPAVELVEAVGGLLVIAVGITEIRAGRLTLGGLLAFIAFLAQLFDPVRSLGRLWTSLHSAAAGAERVVEILDTAPEVTERDGARDPGRVRGLVELDDVTFRYPTAGRDALTGVSLRVEPGETVALTGGSGAGKSTLARLLMRFHDPSAGAVRLDGHDLRDLTLRAVRDNVAVVFQDTPLLDASVRDNIAYGRPGASDAEVEQAARAAGAHDFVAALPDGYATRVGQRGRLLSGGQRQRIAIARAFLRDAPVLVLDEPTSALDEASAAALHEPLARLSRGRATIIVTHDPRLAAVAGRRVHLHDGRLAEPVTE